MVNTTIIARGAEALLIKKAESVVKQRIRKSYRLVQLDEKLRKQRTKREVRILQKAAALIPVPRVLTSSTYDIALEHIQGKKLSDALDSLPNALEVCKQIGISIAKLHDASIIHGDLTTSNMIYTESLPSQEKDNRTLDNVNDTTALKKFQNERAGGAHEEALDKHEPSESEVSGKLYFLDFGLSFESSRVEDKAVDLHLLKEALEAKHFACAHEFFNAALQGYHASKNAALVLTRLKAVEKRGRYKQVY